MRKRNLIIFFIIFIFLPCYSAPIKVGVLTSMPIAYQDKHHNWQGISIDIWKAIADNEHIQYQFVNEGENTELAIDHLQQGQIDILLGPLTANAERVARVEFSQPYFINRMAIAEQYNHKRFLELLFLTFFKVFGWYSLGLLLILFLAVNLWWYVEHKHLHKHHQVYWRGVGFLIWYALILLVSGSVLGIPKKVFSRVLIFIMCTISFLFLSFFISSITSTLTVTLGNTIKEKMVRIKDIQGKNFAVVRGHFAAEIILNYGGQYIETDTLLDALKLLSQGKVDGVPANEIILDAALRFNKFPNLNISPLTLTVNTYAFGLQKGSPMRAQINYQLMKMQDQNKVFSICLRYLDADEAKFCVL